MRPYLGILRDSFHEAFASRVLWILLALTTLFLVAIAPIGISEQAGSFLGDNDIVEREAFIKKLTTAKGAASPAGRIWSQLPADVQQTLVDAQKPAENNRFAVFQAIRRLVEELNKLLAHREFYNAAAWDKVRLDREARELLAKGLDQLADDELARFNRLALEAAFPDEIAASARKQVVFSYLVWKPLDPFPTSRSEIRTGLNLALLVFMSWVPGVVGILLAIIVTASIIPYTYEQGAIDLLLSKPVSRSLVFLTKFLGGCAFILINVTYLIVGLWLVLGWRFELWNQKLLLCIPLFMFLFAIYYSVSALAGVIWRNAIVSVVMTIVLWALCFGLGTAHDLVDTQVLKPRRIVKLVSAGETLLAVNERSEVLRFSQQDREWKEVFAPLPSRRQAGPFQIAIPLVGPIYDPASERLVAVNQFVPRLGALHNSALWIATPDDDWKRREGVASPPGTEALFFGPQQELIAVTASGVQVLRGNPEDRPKNANVFGFDIPLPGVGAKFVEASPRMRFSLPMSVSIHPATHGIAAYDVGNWCCLSARPMERIALPTSTRATKAIPACSPGRARRCSWR